MTILGVSRALAQSTEAVGAALLALPEDQWFERKSARTQSKDLADALVGLGNADGGTIVVGLWNGMVEGTDRDAKRRNDHMQAGIDHCWRDPGGSVRCL